MPFAPHVPKPYMPLPEVLNTSAVLLPLVLAPPVPAGSKIVGSSATIGGGVPSGELQVPLWTGSPAPVVSDGFEVVSGGLVVVVSPPPLPAGGNGWRGAPATRVSRVPGPVGPEGGSLLVHAMKPTRASMA